MTTKSVAVISCDRVHVVCSSESDSIVVNQNCVVYIHELPRDPNHSDKKGIEVANRIRPKGLDDKKIQYVLTLRWDRHVLVWDRVAAYVCEIGEPATWVLVESASLPT